MNQKLTETERMLAEAIDSMLQQDAKLGLSFHDQDHKEQGKAEHCVQYLHEQINDMFILRAAELTHSESITSAFHRVHNYKYLDDWTFIPAMEKEMISRGVPRVERLKALEFIPKIVEELSAEQKLWTEKDSGFNPKLDEIRKVSKPKQDGKFQVHDRSTNKRNVDKPEKGDGSPARTKSGRPPLPGDGHDAEVDPGDGEGN